MIIQVYVRSETFPSWDIQKVIITRSPVVESSRNQYFLPMITVTPRAKPLLSFPYPLFVIL